MSLDNLILPMSVPGAHRYRIADYIPPEYKLKMVAVNYEPTQAIPNVVQPRCANGKCPLGWLFDEGQGDDDPLARFVVQRLVALNVSGSQRDMYKAAIDFITDWDRGLVGDLRVALGL